MKLRFDGTIEGTPLEISEYQNIQMPKVKCVPPSASKSESSLARYSTKEIHEELSKREGLTTFLIPPHQRAVLSIDGIKHQIDGAAFVSINHD